MAAYRRDDWPTGKLSALRRHLEGCADCRRVEADYRGVGERIRRLPSITPPASMREAVLAAIAAERHSVTPAVVELSRAATDPSLPVVRLTRRPPQRDPINIGLRAALIAAALVLTILVARFVPGVSALSRIANSFSQGSDSPAGQAHAPRSLSSNATAYTVPTLLSGENPALATDAWLVFTAATGTDATIYAEDRQHQARTVLFSADASQLVTLRALTDSWALWTTGTETSGPWTLYAHRLPAQSGTATITVASSTTSSFTSLTGIWTDGDTALLTGETTDGKGELVRVDLASGASALLASAAGHLYADPTTNGGVAYWSDVTFDTLRGLRGTIVRLEDGGNVAPADTDAHRFHPVAEGNELAWIAAPDARLTAVASGYTALSAESGAAMLFQLTGAVQVGGNDIGSGDAAMSPSLAAGGNLVIWRTAGGWHCYDAGSNASVNGLAGASNVAITSTAIVWGVGQNVTTLYVAPTR